MSVYVTEEEQIAALRVWLKRYGSTLLSIFLLTAAVILGWQAWQHHLNNQREHASIAYGQLLLSVSNDDAKATHQQAQYILDTYPKTPYADFAALMLAAEAVEKQQYKVADDYMRNVVEHTRQKALGAIVQLRRARIMIEQKHYQQALKLLDEIEDKAFIASVEESKGDLWLKQGHMLKAREAYAQALKHLPKNSPLQPIVSAKFYDLAESPSKGV